MKFAQKERIETDFKKRENEKKKKRFGTTKNFLKKLGRKKHISETEIEKLKSKK